MSSEAHFDFARDRTLYESLFDPGTRMPRRAVLLDRLGQALARARRADSRVAVLLFSEIADIDKPGRVADLGDVARTLRASVRGDETVARGPDSSTLMVVCNMVDSKEHAQTRRRATPEGKWHRMPRRTHGQQSRRRSGDTARTRRRSRARSRTHDRAAHGGHATRRRNHRLPRTTPRNDRPETARQLESAMDTRAIEIKAYLDAQDDT